MKPTERSAKPASTPKTALFATLCALAALALPGVAQAGSCPNEPLRTGPSASLPDCRAYELITPENLGRGQDMTFTGFDHATPSSDGEQIALETNAPIEPSASVGASVNGAHAVFSRTAEGWTMKSAVAPGTSADNIEDAFLFSPDLSQITLTTFTILNAIERSPDKTFEVGPVGGPYTLVANVPRGEATGFVGANAGTASIPPLSDVLLYSHDHALPLSATEHAAVEETVEGSKDLYDWTNGQLRLVNITTAGALTSRCGAVLGRGPSSGEGPGAVNAVSEDGSRIFFMSPEPGSSCPEPSRLYMRMSGRETIEVSAPQGVTIGLSERKAVEYIGATPDGSEVFFTTETVLTPGETPTEQSKLKLFEYNTEAPEGHRLKLISDEFHEEPNNGNRRFFVLSEDGSTVYYETTPSNGAVSIYRYETARATGAVNPRPIARVRTPKAYEEPSYSTRSGEFLLFASDGVTGEPRGAGHNELYQYNNADDSVTCVSCGEGAAPSNGEMLEPYRFNALVETENGIPGLIPMSEDGQEVFFETTSQLVAQDTNSTATENASVSGDPGLDVYEWVADDAEDGPGVFCRVAVGCTFLISAGEDVGPEVFLGASRDGSNLFFASAAQLVPLATPEFTNIYDARVDGGFPRPAAKPECTSCQGVGSPPPLFSVPASVAFQGAGNPVPAAALSSPPRPPVKRAVRCPRGKRLVKGRCVRVRVRGKARARKSSHDRGARR